MEILSLKFVSWWNWIWISFFKWCWYDVLVYHLTILSMSWLFPFVFARTIGSFQNQHHKHHQQKGFRLGYCWRYYNCYGKVYLSCNVVWACQPSDEYCSKAMLCIVNNDFELFLKAKHFYLIIYVTKMSYNTPCKIYMFCTHISALFGMK